MTNDIREFEIEFDANDEYEGTERLIRKLKRKLSTLGINADQQKKLILVGIDGSRTNIEQLLESGGGEGKDSTYGFTFATIDPDFETTHPFTYADTFDEGALALYDAAGLQPADDPHEHNENRFVPRGGKTLRDALIGIIKIKYTGK